MSTNTNNTNSNSSVTTGIVTNNQTHPLRIAINGFGRIGRNVIRAILERQLLHLGNLELVAINDIADPESLVHLLKFDSTHGRLSRIGYDADLTDQGLRLTAQSTDNQSITHKYVQLFKQADPICLPWKDLDIDLVLECSGHFRSYNEANKHRIAGARQVIIGAAPFNEVDACIVMGVNDQLLTLDLPIISSVSCTTQALVPLLAILDHAFKVQSVMMTEIHAVTADQSVLDQAHRDPRRARASGYNIIPTTSSSIKATERVLPQLLGKINGYSIRVPTINVAAVDVNLIFEELVDIDSLNQLLKQSSLTSLKGIMGYTSEPLVSSDFIHQSESLIIDSLQTMKVGNQVKIFAWYDNEWGYANRLVDMCERLFKEKN